MVKISPSNVEGAGLIPGQGTWASLIAKLVKNLPAIQETWLQSLGWEDSLEKGKAMKNLQFPISPSTNPSHTVKIYFF